jgi:hypothetical protein
MFRALTSLKALGSMVLGTIIIASLLYIRIVFDSQHSLESWIEALSFSVQTVTTVGYGNWGVSNASSKCEVSLQLALLWPIQEAGDCRLVNVKMLSIALMLWGALLFAVTVAVMVEKIRDL